jgi:hypothetical protein
MLDGWLPDDIAPDGGLEVWGDPMKDVQMEITSRK